MRTKPHGFKLKKKKLEKKKKKKKKKQAGVEKPVVPTRVQLLGFNQFSHCIATTESKKRAYIPGIKVTLYLPPYLVGSKASGERVAAVARDLLAATERKRD